MRENDKLKEQVVAIGKERAESSASLLKQMLGPVKVQDKLEAE